MGFMDDQRRRTLVQGTIVVVVGVLAGFAQPYVLGPGRPPIGAVIGYAIFIGALIVVAWFVGRAVSRRLYP
jgi:hypothetical protein